QIDAWLDRAAGAVQQGTLILCLKIVDIGPVAVISGIDVVACAVYEVVAIARLCNDAAHHIIDLTPLYSRASRQPFAYQGDAAIACPRHNLKYRGVTQGYVIRRPGKGHPGVIRVNGVRLGETRPEVEKSQVAPLNGIGSGRARLVMRIAGVTIDGDDRWLGSL